MDDQTLIASWQAEEQQPFQGWDFSYLRDRYSEEQPPWSYEDRVRDLARSADSLLDMGTGGGEKLLELADVLPAKTIATEGYPPNIPIARANLEPHGIPVIEYNIDEDSRMPFEDQSFALVINRHEAYDVVEVARILQPGGVFLTQQVDGRDFVDLRALFGLTPTHFHVNLEDCRQEAETAGLLVTQVGNWTGKTTFQDVGALVYFLNAVPWDAPEDFAVERYADLLLDLHRNRHPLTFSIGRFVIQARKPSSSM